MRVSRTVGGVLAMAAVTLAGCSSTGASSSFWNKFSWKKKPAETAGLANAPAAPGLGSTASTTAPTVTMPGATPAATQTSANLPVYPGTNYPVTPYAAPATPVSVAQNSPYQSGMQGQAAYPAQPGATAQPDAVAANPYAAPANAAPYGQTPAAQGYAPQATPAYDPFVAGSQPSPYAPPQAAPAANPAPGAYGSQQPGTYNAAGQPGTYTR